MTHDELVERCIPVLAQVIWACDEEGIVPQSLLEPGRTGGRSGLWIASRDCALAIIPIVLEEAAKTVDRIPASPRCASFAALAQASETIRARALALVLAQ